MRPRLVRRGGACRVEADVAGRAVWFESRDTQFVPSVEAFGSALLVPAMHAGRLLYLHEPACEAWVANFAGLTEVFRTHWYPEAPGAHVIPLASQSTPVPGTALCFSGGVDSFHTLLTGGQANSRLVCILGYDVKLRQRRRAAAVERLVRLVAAETGGSALLIASNLRRHPLVKAAPWLRAFGGALAAAGHLLAQQVGNLLISSDGIGHEDPDVGSHAGIDWRHSSSRLRVLHFAGRATRLEKVRSIASEPLVQRHLHVCWKNVAGHLNCGRCEKCVRTMLALDVCGTLGHFAGFNRGRGLVDAIDALPALEPVVAPFFREMLAAGLSNRAAEATRRLLERSENNTVRHAAVHAVRQVTAPRPTILHRRLLPVEAFANVVQPLVGKSVGYVRPLGNVGDELIELAMAQLFAEFGIRWSLCDLDHPADFDVLVFGGGGNMGIRYTNNYDLRTRALDLGIPLTVLPQSFTTAEDRPFQQVFVRERESLRLHAGGILAPDLASGLAWPRAGRPTRDVGIFLRRDRERRGARPLLAQ